MTVHYIDETDYTAFLWYGMPGTHKALSQPTKKPTITNLSYGGRRFAHNVHLEC